MYRGACESSPSAFRISRMVTFSTASPTNTPGQTLLEQLRFVIRRPGLGGEVLQHANAFGVSGTARPAVELAAHRIEPEAPNVRMPDRLPRSYRILTILSPSSYGV